MTQDMHAHTSRAQVHMHSNTRMCNLGTCSCRVHVGAHGCVHKSLVRAQMRCGCQLTRAQPPFGWYAPRNSATALQPYSRCWCGRTSIHHQLQCSMPPALQPAQAIPHKMPTPHCARWLQRVNPARRPQTTTRRLSQGLSWCACASSAATMRTTLPQC
jgi:hypothetical protein